jgi:ribosomal protein L39E
MLPIRTMQHIATSRSIPSFRSCRTQGRAYQTILNDQGRMMQGYAAVLAHDARRKWRNVQAYAQQ